MTKKKAWLTAKSALQKEGQPTIMYRDDLIRAAMAVQRYTDDRMKEETGLSRPTIRAIRKGEQENPSLQTLKIIADKLDIPMSRLFEPKKQRQRKAA